MNIVPIISDGSLVKIHTEYPVTNNQWKLMDNGLGLWDYLTTLKLFGADTNSQMILFAGIRYFYLRVRYNADPYTEEFNSDPWGRKFMVYPPERQRDRAVYRYYSFYSHELYLDVNVIITTVNKSRVYCLDVVRFK